jgi:hypothetical protein
MGNKGAREFGMEEAPNTIEEAITKTTAKVSHSLLCYYFMAGSEGYLMGDFRVD